ncbi:MAG: hypothetical protein HKP58_17250 [Desulfatitalea sp.]|nr:hypothetical protein [Desulfatitalea sp.]NNK02161.1 hypothetical protein [Desulfatitalea sp.]
MKEKLHAASRVEKRWNKASSHLLWTSLLCGVICLLMMPMSAFGDAHTIGEDLFGVSFPEAGQGWVCGRYGVIYHSTDGGATWEAQNTGTRATLTSVFFVDSKSGWAVGDASTIIHTEDGGNTWAPQESPVENFYLMDVFFVSPDKGWIVTEKTYILYTDNGGKTWTVQFSDQDFILKAVSFSDPVNGWAVGEYGYTYHTDDGGAHWQWQAGEFGQDMQTGKIIAGNYLFGVTAVDAHRAWAVGIDGHVVTTTDGGGTWQTIQTGLGKVALKSVTTDRSGQMVAIAGKEGIWVSMDEGKTWTKPSFQPPIGYRWFYRIAPKETFGFAVVGMEGSIYHNDGPSLSGTWQSIGK